MTSHEKEKVLKMRNEGLSYSRIADYLGISENTIKALCRRNRLITERREDAAKSECLPVDSTACWQCGKPLMQDLKRKEKKFCSDACRHAWWIAHEAVNANNTVKHFTCAFCGKTFMSYGNQCRKYCGHACYIKKRFGKEGRSHVSGAV